MDQLKALTRTRDAIRDGGEEHFNMAYWYRTVEYGSLPLQSGKANLSDCGTTACLAGWAVAVNPEIQIVDPHENGTISKVAEALGISSDMFYPESWPDEQRQRADALRIIEGLEWTEADRITLLEWLDAEIEARS